MREISWKFEIPLMSLAIPKGEYGWQKGRQGNQESQRVKGKGNRSLTSNYLGEDLCSGSAIYWTFRQADGVMGLRPHTSPSFVLANKLHGPNQAL